MTVANREMIVVKVASGLRAGESFCFRDASRIFIGSDPKSEICISDDPAVQPKHVVLDMSPPDCRILVMAGRPLVRVNGRVTGQARLQKDDQFRVGKTSFEVTFVDAANERSATEALEKTIIHREAPPAESAAAPSPSVNPPPGYSIVRCIGQGAMGVIFEGLHAATQARVAIKFLHPTGASCDEAVRLFLREANVLSQLNHKRIVQFQELGWVDGRVFLAMEYVDTIDLQQLLRSVDPAKRLRLAIGVICQVLEALHYAHARQVVHRDVKPSNILVSRDRKGLHARLSDFGLAKNFENAGFSGMTEEGEARGTVPFMAPEQFRDCLRAKPSADIFSVGVSLFFMLTDQFPFTETSSVVKRLKSLDQQPLPLHLCMDSAPVGLSPILLKSMQLEPADRFRTANEMRNALLPYIRRD